MRVYFCRSRCKDYRDNECTHSENRKRSAQKHDVKGQKLRDAIFTIKKKGFANYETSLSLVYILLITRN